MTVEEIIEYVIHTPGNTNPNVLKTFVEALASEGGSGSSDISYANILIENKTNSELSFILPSIVEEENSFELRGFTISENSNTTFQLPLYKNKIVIEGNSTFYVQDEPLHPLLISTSGSINNNNGELTISGDGTIEVTDLGGPDDNPSVDPIG